MSSFLPTAGGVGRSYRWSYLNTLCLPEVMMLPFNFVFCGLVSIFLVYSPNSKSEEVLVTDYFSSIPYYCYYLMKKIKSDWSMCQGSHVNSQSQDMIMPDLIFQRLI